MKVSKIAIAAGVALAGFSMSVPAQAQERTLGEIFMGGWNFCPRGSASTDGQLLAISQNTALFSLLGTIYGGDGRTTFGLPDMRSRSPMGQGNGPGLSTRQQGQKLGAETSTLSVANLAAHSHTGTLTVHRANADTGNPNDNYLAKSTVNTYSDDPGAQTGTMHASTLAINNTGGSQSFNDIHPVSVIRFCIATQGIFPSRN